MPCKALPDVKTSSTHLLHRDATTPSINSEAAVQSKMLTSQVSLHRAARPFSCSSRQCFVVAKNGYVSRRRSAEQLHRTRAAPNQPQTTQKTFADMTIDDLDTNYCDDFVCTSSPAVEQTVRSLVSGSLGLECTHHPAVAACPDPAGLRLRCSQQRTSTLFCGLCELYSSTAGAAVRILLRQPVSSPRPACPLPAQLISLQHSKHHCQQQRTHVAAMFLYQ